MRIAVQSLFKAENTLGTLYSKMVAPCICNRLKACRSDGSDRHRKGQAGDDHCLKACHGRSMPSETVSAKSRAGFLENLNQMWRAHLLDEEGVTNPSSLG